MSLSFYLPDFGRFWEPRDQPQPGSFLAPGSKREDPGNEVEMITQLLRHVTSPPYDADPLLVAEDKKGPV